MYFSGSEAQRLLVSQGKCLTERDRYTWLGGLVWGLGGSSANGKPLSHSN